MNGERLKACLAAIGWSYRQLAEKVGRNEKQVRRWADEGYVIPDYVARPLEDLARVHLRYAGRWEAPPAPPVEPRPVRPVGRPRGSVKDRAAA